MASRYAANTTVGVDRSQIEIQKILRKFGASRFGTMESPTHAFVMFEYKNFMIQMDAPLPKAEDFKKTDAGRSRKSTQVNAAYEQAIKQRWRSLILSVKAKLIAIEDGISTVEKEFMAFVMMPDGKSLGDHFLPKLVEIAKTGNMPRMIGMTKPAQE
jgi:hypothetical protein